jgi:ubiquinone/menaquinone biosynthesis C-methylase UbiE
MGHRAGSIGEDDRSGPARPPATTGIQFGRASAHELPLPDSRVDLLLMSQVYNHLPDPAVVARECWRVLRADSARLSDGRVDRGMAALRAHMTEIG